MISFSPAFDAVFDKESNCNCQAQVVLHAAQSELPRDTQQKYPDAVIECENQGEVGTIGLEGA
jgi:hypothetical protein